MVRVSDTDLDLPEQEQEEEREEELEEVAFGGTNRPWSQQSLEPEAFAPSQPPLPAAAAAHRAAVPEVSWQHAAPKPSLQVGLQQSAKLSTPSPGHSQAAPSSFFSSQQAQSTSLHSEVAVPSQIFFWLLCLLVAGLLLLSVAMLRSFIAFRGFRSAAEREPQRSAEEEEEREERREEEKGGIAPQSTKKSKEERGGKPLKEEKDKEDELPESEVWEEEHHIHHVHSYGFEDHRICTTTAGVEEWYLDGRRRPSGATPLTPRFAMNGSSDSNSNSEASGPCERPRPVNRPDQTPSQ